MIWRLVISDEDPNLEGAELRRVFDDPQNPVVRASMPGTRQILKLTDPLYGDDLAVFTTLQAANRMHMPYDFVDFDLIPAIVGAVVKPESDGVRVESTDDYIAISRQGGLALASLPQADVVKPFLADASSDSQPERLSQARLFFFRDWRRTPGGADYIAGRRALEGALVQAGEEDKPAALLRLARFHLAHDLGPEALGYLEMAETQAPHIADIPDYNASLGAAAFLAGRMAEASALFQGGGIADNAEVRLWQAAALARGGDAPGAVNAYPDNADIAADYPFPVRFRVLSPLIDAMLAQGETDKAEAMLAMLTDDPAVKTRIVRAALAYNAGRLQKATGYPEKAEESFGRATRLDRRGPYGARAEMILVKDGLDRGTVDMADAIARLERLRFLWRGDALETEIYRNLSALYVQNGEGRKSLALLKRAAENTNSALERREIVRQMADIYKNLFTGEAFDTLDPMEAVAVYDSFKELTPVGEEGNLIISRLADKLMEVDLMSRAVSVLEDKMARLETGREAIRTGLRVAAIYLIDRRAEAAMETLSRVDSMLAAYDGDDRDDLDDKALLLKARALADMGRYQDALFMMEGLPLTEDVLRLRVDTAWRAADWVAASDTLARLIALQNLNPSYPPTEEQARMMLNQAIALNLAGQEAALRRFADAHDLYMQQTPLYQTFRLVTREGGDGALADRQTLMNAMSEVDLFSGFLTNTQ